MLQQALQQRPRPVVPTTGDDRRASASETPGSSTSTVDVFALDFDGQFVSTFFFLSYTDSVFRAFRLVPRVKCSSSIFYLSF